MIETSAALASPGSSAPMKGNILAPQGLSPAPGPVTKGPDGKPNGPQFIADSTKSPQQIQKEFAKSRADKIAGFTAEVVPGEEVDATAADPTAAEGTVEEPAVDPVGKDATAEAESADARLARIQKAAAKSRSDATRFRQQKDEIARRDADISRMRQQTAALEAQARRSADFERSVLADPLKALEQRGVTPEQLAQRVLLAGTPEEKLALMQQQLEAQQKQFASIEKQRADERALQQFQTKLASAENVFVEMAGNDEKYPNLAGHPRQALLAMGKQIAQEAKAKYLRDYGTDFIPTDRQILGYMNKLYAKQATATETPANPSKAAKPSGKASPKPASPRTMTSGQAAGSFARPTNWDSLSRAQRVAAMRQEMVRGK